MQLSPPCQMGHLDRDRGASARLPPAVAPTRPSRTVCSSAYETTKPSVATSRSEAPVNCSMPTRGGFLRLAWIRRTDPAACLTLDCRRKIAKTQFSNSILERSMASEHEAHDALWAPSSMPLSDSALTTRSRPLRLACRRASSARRIKLAESSLLVRAQATPILTVT